jgi:hypothetical protein
VSAYLPPSGYTQIGSKWEIWKKEEIDAAFSSKTVSTIVYEKEVAGTDRECVIPARTLEEGEYEWRMSYKWRNSQNNEGYTTWSEMVDMTVVPPTPGGGGGCSTFGLGAGLLALAGVALLTKCGRR